jgi:hypothetical protein
MKEWMIGLGSDRTRGCREKPKLFFSLELIVPPSSNISLHLRLLPFKILIPRLTPLFQIPVNQASTWNSGLRRRPLNATRSESPCLDFSIKTPRNPRSFGTTSLVIMCPTTSSPIFPSAVAAGSASLVQHALARTYTPASAVSLSRIDLGCSFGD